VTRANTAQSDVRVAPFDQRASPTMTIDQPKVRT